MKGYRHKNFTSYTNKDRSYLDHGMDVLFRVCTSWVIIVMAIIALHWVL